MKRNKSNIKSLIIVLIFVFITIALSPHFFRHTYTITVSNKQIKKQHDKSIYMIYAQMDNGNVRTFKDINSLVEFKFNSDDIYGGLQIYRKYEIRTYGFRIPIISCYENIVKVKKLKDNFIYPENYFQSN
ncbi:DUF1523 family protein [Clostridium sp. LBM24168]